MDALKPIPTPAAQRWREFRIQALPLLTFLAILACVGVLWQRYVFPSNIVAQVEATTASIITTEPAKIEQLHVVRFQRVKKGDPIATVSIMDSNLVHATLETVRADLSLMQSRISIGQLRAEQSYERERLAVLEQHIQLEEDKVNLTLATIEFKRLDDLLRNSGSVATNDYDIAKFKVEALTIRVVQTSNFLAESERILPSLRPDTNSIPAIEASIAANRKLLEEEGADVVLRAPIDGVITVISNRAGERVMPGAPIAVITATDKPERIIAYMRPPITDLPRPGDTLQVRRRTFKRQAAVATVQDVGVQLEPLAPALALMGTTTVELGLPFSISIPPSMTLLPGEVVDIIVSRK
jgi:multidrug resistance efflux pump